MGIPPELFASITGIEHGIGRLEKGQDDIKESIWAIRADLDTHKADQVEHGCRQCQAEQRGARKPFRGLGWIIGIASGIAMVTDFLLRELRK